MKLKYIVLLTIFLFLSSIILLTPVASAQFPASNDNLDSNITITVNGQPLNTDTPPIINGGRVMAPLRSLAEALQAQVDWDPISCTVTVTQENNTIQLLEGSKTAYKNNQPVSLDISVYLVQGRVMVPVRFIAESLGAAVEWNGKKRIVNIFTPVVIPKGQSTPASIAFQPLTPLLTPP